MAIILLLLLAPSLAAADVFCDNVKAIATTLSKNAASSPVHFATKTFGGAPNVVFALGLCRGDVLDGPACGDCIANWFGKALNRTRCDKARSTYGDCIVVYSAGDDILAAPSNTTGAYGDNTPPFQQWNIKNVTTGDVPLVVGLVRELLVETAEKAATTEPRLYATGVMDMARVTTYPKVYSQAQCTPDLSADDCSACLRRLLGMVNSTMSLRIGGQMAVTRCYFRYEAYRFYDAQPMLILPSRPPPTTPTKRRSMVWVIAVVAVPLSAAAFLFFNCYSRRLKRRRKGMLPNDLVERLNLGREGLVWQGKNSEFSLFHFEQLLEATSYFSEENKLGQGGFGAVYKGQLPDGLEIALKRLASHSGQGFAEFKNEVQLIAKLQHTNLVRFLGCCSQEEEKILVYEYLPNKSLDIFIFDEYKRALLDWTKLLEIIEGVAHGLLYLHKHSRLLVIHRDLKPSNILLDSEMNPKISDFGLAKIFSKNDTEGDTTRRVVGTYGYMAPEYASKGVFSIKSDVFSFGVVIFEILSGKQNSGNQQCGGFVNLLGYAWQLWEQGKWIDLLNASLVPDTHLAKLMRCINIALLCVQENAVDRPTMGDIVSMLRSDTMILAKPKQPAYINVRVGNEETSNAPELCSINDITISATIPR
ncbi:putative receptor-like protein kinase At4g00960 [Triticum dicoccoides]|uniref:putative receptor-like protein kinase At4g00960 n=1 Tax=Triticum dicoccoides TaxID=85692 RepID=UPI00188E8178|nr:putative receptor-like protein kinase At4g00960 [Triticum dicoccoides]